MSQYAIQVEHLSKSYRIRQGERAGYTALRDVLSERTGKFFGRLAKGKNPFQGDETHEEFWALNDVSFNVEHGEVLGIIGRNGAGKSTLLKLLSRITEPDKGKITLNGRVASLLEVGTGFHPELTGRENIYLSGAILGMRREEIKKRFDEIVDFAGVEKFLDTPVKRYSSGMYVRLGFAVAAHLETEILLVDEVLAVGDVEFQRRCIDKIGDVTKNSKTVIIVSHNLVLLKSLCSIAMLIEDGKIFFQGNSDVTVELYENRVARILSPSSIYFRGNLTQLIKLIDVKVNEESIFSKSEKVSVSSFRENIVSVGLSINTKMKIRVNIGLYKDGIRLFTMQDLEECKEAFGLINSVFKIPEKLLRPGFYTLGIGGVGPGLNSDWFWARDVALIEVEEEWSEEVEYINHGLINVFSQNNRT